MRPVLAVIPARGGSKRLKDKNILAFEGRPMIGHVLEAARASGVFDEIHVSTESERIRDVVRSLGFEVPFLRDASLADDTTPLMPVLRWVLQRFASAGRAFDDVCLLMATAPLIEAADLSEAYRAYRASGGRSLLAVARYPVPVEWAFDRAEDGTLVPCQPGMFAVRSQDLRPKYYDTGSIAFFPVSAVLSGAPPDDRSFVSYVLPPDKAVDIDDEDDLRLARALFRARRGSGR
jgi:N-acylneuraminate cytidylyltransferase